MRRHAQHDFEVGYLFLRPGNSLSGKDPRGPDEVASVGYFTGAGNIVVFVGDPAEASDRYDRELAECLERLNEEEA